MKILLSISLMLLFLLGCSPSAELVVSNKIDEVKTIINPDCFHIKEKKCHLSIITDKNELFKIVSFLNARKKKWSYASTTYPGAKLSSIAKLNNKEVFQIYIGINWIGIAIKGKQVLQAQSKEELIVLKKLLKII